jgi:hypothetical protein
MKKMNDEKPHGMTGKRNAAKETHLAEERITFAAPKGTRTAIVRAANGKKVSVWIREAISEKLQK